MLKLVRTEFLKLRRRRRVWSMFLAAFLMPVLSVCYFGYLGQTEVAPAQFYKWSAFGWTTWIILPVVLGIFGTMIVYEEKRLQIVRQIRLVPVSGESYFFSKFCMLLIWSVGFMLLTAVASVVCSVLPGFVSFRLGGIAYLFEKCMEIGCFLAFAMMPILTLAISQSGYVFPVCMTIVYTLAGFFLMPVNMYLHPITSMGAILIRNHDIPGITVTQEISVMKAFLCIALWDLVSFGVARYQLCGKKQG